MIDRYTTPEMAQIWSEQNKFETWKKVEITVTEVLSDRGEVPKEAVKVINEKAAFSLITLTASLGTSPLSDNTSVTVISTFFQVSNLFCSDHI
jgi:adenylosuccinate lyase